MKAGDVVLVTGANSGTGKATALALAKMGAKVVMLCRNIERGQEALAQVQAESGNKSVELMLCDLASLEDVRRSAAEFRRKFSSLSVLINNAGVVLAKRQETMDGFERQFGVNHLGHFLLTNLLLDLITDRIVVVSSGAHKIGKIHFNDINLVQGYEPFKAYGQSKLANILFTYELARRLKETGVTANCLHPGAVATNIAFNRETGFGKNLSRAMKYVFFLPPSKGAETIIYLASSPEMDGVTGKYFYKKKPVKSSPLSYYRELAVQLWELSEQMTELSSP